MLPKLGVGPWQYPTKCNADEHADCVVVRAAGGKIEIGDSKRDGVTLALASADFRRFIDQIKAGVTERFDGPIQVTVVGSIVVLSGTDDLAFYGPEWRQFVAAIRLGEYDTYTQQEVLTR